MMAKTILTSKYTHSYDVVGTDRYFLPTTIEFYHDFKPFSRERVPHNGQREAPFFLQRY